MTCGLAGAAAAHAVLPHLAQGATPADVAAEIGTIDVVLGSVDC
jgi:hypothetical protein